MTEEARLQQALEMAHAVKREKFAVQREVQATKSRDDWQAQDSKAKVPEPLAH